MYRKKAITAGFSVPDVTSPGLTFRRMSDVQSSELTGHFLSLNFLFCTIEKFETVFRNILEDAYISSFWKEFIDWVHSLK